MEAMGPISLPLNRYRAFANGVHVLLVDYDRTCLMSVARMLEQCSYRVTTVELASIALLMFRAQEGQYDVVIADVHNPDMDGFTFLSQIRTAENTVFFLMSADKELSIAKRALQSGACYFLQKPITKVAVKTIWQHVHRKMRDKILEMEQEHPAIQPAPPAVELAPEGIPLADEHEPVIAMEQEINPAIQPEPEQIPPTSEHEPVIAEENDRQNVSKVNEKQKGKGKGLVEDENPDKIAPQIVWTEERHRKFLRIIDGLGGPISIECLPKKIQEMMDDPNISRLQVSSHLQKYRTHVGHVIKLSANLPPNVLACQDSETRPRQSELISHPAISFNGTPSIGGTPKQMIHPHLHGRPVGQGLFDRNLVEGSSSMQRKPYEGLDGRLNKDPYINYKSRYTGYQMTSNGELTSVNGGLASSINLNNNMWNKSVHNNLAPEPSQVPYMGLNEKPCDLSRINYISKNSGVQVMSINEHNGTPNCINLSGNSSKKNEKENFALGTEACSLQIWESGTSSFSSDITRTTSSKSSQSPHQTRRTFTDLLAEQHNTNGVFGSFSSMVESSMFENSSLPQNFNDHPNHQDVSPQQDEPDAEDLGSFLDPSESPFDNNSLHQFNEFNLEKVFNKQGQDMRNAEDLGYFSDLPRCSMLNNSLPKQPNEFNHEENFPKQGQDDPNTKNLGSLSDPPGSYTFENNSLTQQFTKFNQAEVCFEQIHPNTKDLGSFLYPLNTNMFGNNSLQELLNHFDHEDIFPALGQHGPQTVDPGSFSDPPARSTFTNSSIPNQFNEFNHEEFFPEQANLNSEDFGNFSYLPERPMFENNSFLPSFNDFNLTKWDSTFGS